MLVKYLRALLNQFAKKSDFIDGTINTTDVVDYGAKQAIEDPNRFVAPKDGIIVRTFSIKGGQSSTLSVEHDKVSGIYLTDVTYLASTMIDHSVVGKGQIVEFMGITAGCTATFYPYK